MSSPLHKTHSLFLTTVLFSICVSGSAYAQETKKGDHRFNVTIGAAIEDSWAPKTIMTLNTVAGMKAKTQEQTTLYGTNFALGYTVPSNNFLSGTIFGENPELKANIAIRHGNSLGHDIENSPAANSLLWIDGNIGSSWIDGSWYSKTDIKDNHYALQIEGDKNDSGWSIAPSFALNMRDYAVEYDLIRRRLSNGAESQFLEGDLKSDMYGATIGVSLLTPHYNGWRFGITPQVKAMVSYAEGEVQQDPNSVYGAVADIKVSDKKTSGYYEAGLNLSAEKQIGVFTLSATVNGSAGYGLPYLYTPRYEGDSFSIKTDKASYKAGGMLNLKYSF